MKIEQLIHEHPCFFEDLRIASELLKNKRPIVAASLADYADALYEYDTESIPRELPVEFTYIQGVFSGAMEVADISTSYRMEIVRWVKSLLQK